MYHDARLEGISDSVVVTTNEVWHRLKLYFETLTPPTEAQLRQMLGLLRRRRLVRVQWHEDTARFGESEIEILPTLPRVIPFENAAAWDHQAAAYRQPGEPGEPTPPSEVEP
jgi:hypothetical protein